MNQISHKLENLSHASLKLLYDKIKKLDPNKVYEVTVKEFTGKRSVSQNKYLHFLYGFIADFTGDDKESIESILDVKFGGKTSEMTPKELASYITRIKAWAETELDLVCPEPENVE